MKARKAFYCSPGGILSQVVEANNMQAMMNPDMMGNMLKGSMFMMFQQFVMFSVIGYFFSGFINARMPFPLAQSFRSMLQQGLTLENLDVRYVSSLSWCFILMYGF